jgi:3,4-dihydroxy 2-butanone 4-phosphate synthase
MSRENEGDLIMAAADCTTDKMAFMIRYTSGYVCAPITIERAESLELPQMVINNRDPHRTAYTVTVDALGPDVTTGISAQDRAHTVRTLANPQATAANFRRPGHILPLKAKAGGVRVRRGHTEAAVELCRLAGKPQAAVICEMIMDGEPVPGRAEFTGGRMMRRDDCLAFGKKWNIKVCTIEDLVDYVEAREGKLKGQ